MARSYAWSVRLAEEVADTGTIVVPTPGFNTPENYKTDETGVVLDGHVLTPEQASVVWDGEFKSATVTNSSGNPWHPSQTLYLTVPGKIESADDAMEALKGLDNQVSGLQTQVSALEARVAALEGVVAGQSVALETLRAQVDALPGQGGGPKDASAPDKARARHAEDRPRKSEDEEQSSVKRDEKAEHQHGEHAKRDEDKKHKDAPGTPHWDDKKKK